MKTISHMSSHLSRTDKAQTAAQKVKRVEDILAEDK